MSMRDIDKGMAGRLSHKVVLRSIHETDSEFSDAFLKKAESKNGIVKIGSHYKAIIVPACIHIPLDTQEKLNILSENGVNVFYIDQIADFPAYPCTII